MTSQTDLPPDPVVRRVLVVDDDPGIRAVISSLLTRAGLHAELAVNGAEALTAIACAVEPFDLVILDLTMPEMSGKETIKEIVRNGLNVPIIICSGSTSKIEAAVAVSAGSVVGVIPKPFSMLEFLQKIHDALKLNPTPSLTLPEVLRL